MIFLILNLFITEQLSGKDVDNSDNTITINTSDISGITDISWVNFDQERFGIGYSGGGIGTITSDAFSISGNTVTIRGLDNTLSSSDTVVNVTAVKNNIQSKTKTYSRSRTLSVEWIKIKRIWK